MPSTITNIDTGPGGDTVCAGFQKANTAFDNIPVSAGMAGNGVLRFTLNDGTNWDAFIPPTDDQIINGLAMTIDPTDALVLTVSSGIWRINGSPYSTASDTDFAIPAGHATLPRIDALYASTAGLEYQQGTAAASPTVPSGAGILVGIVTVDAGADSVSGTATASLSSRTEYPNFLRFGATAAAGTFENILFGPAAETASGSSRNFFAGGLALSVGGSGSFFWQPLSFTNAGGAAYGDLTVFGSNIQLATADAKTKLFAVHSPDVRVHGASQNCLFFNATFDGDGFAADNCGFFGVSITLGANESNSYFFPHLGIRDIGVPAVTQEKLYNTGGTLTWERALQVGSGNTLDNSSFAVGTGNAPAGHLSAAVGTGLETGSYASLAVGRYNDTAGASGAAWADTDPLFVAGNGTGSGSRSDALVLYKNGNLYINGRVRWRGASQSANAGFGASDNIFWVDSSGGPVTVLLPESPLAGEEVTVADAGGASGTNSITVDGNGVTINGASTHTIALAYAVSTFVYNGTEWNVKSAAKRDGAHQMPFPFSEAVSRTGAGAFNSVNNYFSPQVAVPAGHAYTRATATIRYSTQMVTQTYTLAVMELDGTTTPALVAASAVGSLGGAGTTSPNVGTATTPEFDVVPGRAYIVAVRRDTGAGGNLEVHGATLTLINKT